jgi:hypothetical protein
MLGAQMEEDFICLAHRPRSLEATAHLLLGARPRSTPITLKTVELSPARVVYWAEGSFHAKCTDSSVIAKHGLPQTYRSTWPARDA